MNIYKVNKVFMSFLIGGTIGLISVFIGIKSFSLTTLSLVFSLIPPIVIVIYSFMRNKGIIEFSNPLFLYSSFYATFFGIGGLLYDGEYHDKVVLGSYATMLGVVGYLGAYFFSDIFRKNKTTNNVEEFLFNENNLTRSLRFEKVLFSIGLLGYILYTLKIGNIPLFMNDLEQARVDASVKGGANLRVLASFLILSATIGFLNIKIYKINNNRFLKTAIFRYVISIILLLLLGNRSPVYNIFFTSFLIFIILEYKGRLKLSKLIPIAIIGLIAIVAFVGGVGAYRVVNTETFSSYSEYKNFLYNRDYIGLSVFVFTHYLSIGFENLLRVLAVFPHILDYKFGISYFEPILTVLPGTQYTLDMQIKMALNQTYLGGGTVPSVLGEAYANFGYLGWFFVPFFSMLLLRTIYFKMINSSNSIFLILIYAFLLNHFSNSLLSGLASSSIFPFITLAVNLYYGTYIFTNKESKKVFS